MAMAQVGAAVGVKDRERTINFYELVKGDGHGAGKRMAMADWGQILEGIREKPLSQRVYNGPTRTLIGEVMHVDGGLHLKLLLVRDQGAWLSIYRSEKDSIEELDLGPASQLVEISIIGFLSFGNVIGLIQGSPSAPGVGALEEWLMGLKVLGDFPLDSSPMVSNEAQQMLLQSSEASRIEVTMHTNRADALENRGSGLSGVLRKVNADYGPMKVTVILQASRSRDQHEGRAALRAEAKILADASDAQEIARANAKLIYIDADESTHTETVNFVKQKITAKRRIATTGEDGSPIRNEAAVRAILQVAQENDEELRAIVASDA
jgi:hypothetical protein